MNPVTGVNPVLFLEAAALIKFPTECPHHADTCQVLLRNCGQLSLLLVSLLKSRTDPAVKEQAVENNHRDKNCRRRGKPYMNPEHEKQRQSHQNQRAQQRRQLV